VDITKPCDFFDKASQNNDLFCGGGDLLFLSKNHSLKLKMGLGPNTNNYAKLMTLKLLLLFSKQKEVDTVQTFGDSLKVMNWAQKLQKCSNIFLLPLLEEVHII
jgi:ribonuclease HI